MEKEKDKPKTNSGSASSGRRDFLKIGGGLVAGLIIGAAAGWVGKPTEITPPVTETVTQTITQTASATTVAPPPTWPPSVEPASLTVLSSPDCADALKYAADVFTATYPKVSVDVVPLSWEALYPKILQDLQSKTGAYDVFTIDVMTLGSVVAAGSANIDNIRAANPDIVDPNLDLSDFEKGYFQYGSIWAGADYGLPVYPNHMFLYYRKDYFGDPKVQANYKSMTGKDLAPPATWQDCIDVAKFFTKKNNPSSPTQYGIALMFPTTHTMMYNVLNWLGPIRQSPTGVSKYGALDYYYGDFCTSDGKVWFANDDGANAVEMIQALLPYSPDPFGSDYGETVTQFGAGTTAMAPQWSVPYGSWATTLAGGDLEKAKSIIGVSMMPGISDSGQIVQRPVSGGWSMGINGSSKSPRQAYLFAQFATSKTMDKTHWLKFVMPPARTSNWDEESRAALNPDLFDTYKKSLSQLSYRPRITQEPDMERLGNPLWQDIIAGRKPLTDGLKTLADQWQALVDQFKHP
jgi:ABC-type glycerol-3-phosphate transport system substrate-binding protein